MAVFFLGCLVGGPAAGAVSVVSVSPKSVALSADKSTIVRINGKGLKTVSSVIIVDAKNQRRVDGVIGSYSGNATRGKLELSITGDVKPGKYLVFLSEGGGPSAEVPINLTVVSSRRKKVPKTDKKIRAPILASIVLKSAKGEEKGGAIGIVTLRHPVAIKATVSLRSSDTRALTVPTSVNVKTKERTATFPITMHNVSKRTKVRVTASLDNVEKSATFQVEARNPAFRERVRTVGTFTFTGLGRPPFKSQTKTTGTFRFIGTGRPLFRPQNTTIETFRFTGTAGQ